jgi:cytochrome c-type biogenesis protein CcmH
MIFFWLGIGLMTFAALGFILWPWARSYSTSIYFVTALFLIVVILAWHQWGNKKEITQWLEIKQDAPAIKDLKAQLGNSPEQVIARLKKQVEKNPKSAKGWYLLGKLYMSQRQFQDAIDVFAKANELQPSDKDIMMDYAQALFVAQKTNQAVVLARQVLAQDPQNPRAINLLGSNAFQEGQYQEAINQWEKLRNYYLFGSDDANALEAAIERAKMALDRADMKN